MSEFHNDLEWYELWIRKQEWCPKEPFISKMIFKKFVEKTWGAKFLNDNLAKLLDKNPSAFHLMKRLEFRFTRDKRLAFLKECLKEKGNKERDLKLLSLLE